MTTLPLGHRMLLEAAYQQALKSRREGGIPIGSALGLPDGTVLAVGHNLRVQTGDTTAHAEVVCMRNAGRRRDWSGLVLASTLSPCIMCTGTALLHRVGAVVIGEHTTYLGAEDLFERHEVPLTVAHDPRCIELMHAFIRDHADLWNEDIGL
ncbi:MAG: nucleoside deaminase [Phycisphaerales bacterium]